MLLQSMYLGPSGYGWTVGVHGYEPIPTLDPITPEELLWFTSCNCKFKEIAAIDSAAARRTVLMYISMWKLQTFRARTALMMQSLRKTQTLTPESFNCFELI